MSLIKVNELLQHATEHHYGVPAINVINTETIRYAIQAAEDEHMPIIIQYWPGFEDHCALDIIAFAARYYAERASVPVAVHQDHSAGYEIAVKGVKAGFPSVMVDGSSLLYEENFQLTKDVVQVAKIFDVDIEAELGHVGNGSDANDFVNSDHYTDPNLAEEFVEGTGCGSLAIAVGNAHGPLRQGPEPRHGAHQGLQGGRQRPPRHARMLRHPRRAAPGGREPRHEQVQHRHGVLPLHVPRLREGHQLRARTTATALAS